MVAETVDPRRLVFIDEMGTNTSLAPLYAYSLKGRRGLTLRCRATVERTLRCSRA
jgi:hypothetical protein